MNNSFPFGIPPLADPATVAVFLDFDGTLVEFADDPEAVRLAPATEDCLSRLFRQLGGALAIITGRDIASVDRFLAPQVLPVAGVHGLVRRDATGTIHDIAIDANLLTQVSDQLSAFARPHEGLLVERKTGSTALHFRRRPDLAAPCRQAAERAVAGRAGITLMRGKAVVEARLDGSDKGRAIQAFLEEAPFAGRCPLFAGDDVTDEAGFARVNELGGITVKVGAGPTCAHHRVPAVADFRHWLCDTADRFETQEAS